MYKYELYNLIIKNLIIFVYKLSSCDLKKKRKILCVSWHNSMIKNPIILGFIKKKERQLTHSVSLNNSMIKNPIILYKFDDKEIFNSFKNIKLQEFLRNI